MRIRASDMAALFEVYMLAVVLLALKTALDAGGPWYGPDATFWTYASTFVGGMILVSVLMLAALFLARTKEPEYMVKLAPSTNPSSSKDRPTLDDQEFEGLLESLEQVAGLSQSQKGAAAGRILEKRGVQIASALTPTTTRRRSKNLLLIFLGPAVTATVFAGIAAALLPASAAEGFLATNFVLNTTFILTFSYGWGALIAYALASLFLAASET